MTLAQLATARYRTRFENVHNFQSTYISERLWEELILKILIYSLAFFERLNISFFQYVRNMSVKSH